MGHFLAQPVSVWADTRRWRAVLSYWPMSMIFRCLWRLLPANPVVVQIIQGGSRRQHHHWVRTGYLGVLVGLVVMGLMAGGGMRDQVGLTELAKAGASVFSIVSDGQVILICLLAPLFMSGSIAQGRVGPTLDILLATPLTNVQIVLGSLVGRLFFVLALLASGLPLYSVLLVFGGVPIRAVGVSFAVAGLSAFVMGSMAVALWVWRAGSWRAVFLFVIATGAYLVAVYGLDTFVLRRAGATTALAGTTTTWLTPLHPLLVLEASVHSGSYHPPSADVLGAWSVWARFYWSRPFASFAILSGVISFTLLAVSTVALRRIGQGHGGGGLAIRLISGLGLGKAVAGMAVHRKPRKVAVNPIAWRESHIRGGRTAWRMGQTAFMVMGLAAGPVLLVAYHHGRLPALSDPIGGIPLKPHEVFRLLLGALILVEMSVIVLVAVYTSAGCVSREREDGTLDLILTTPVTAHQYVWGKLRGLVRFLAMQLAVPVVTLAVIGLYAVGGRFIGWAPATVLHSWVNRSGLARTTTVDLILPESPVLLGLVLVPFVALCVAVGMSWSLRSKGVLGAVAPSVGVIGCLTMVSGFCGYNAVSTVPLLGPVLNAFSPVTHLIAVISPWDRVGGFLDDRVAGRMSLAVGAALGGGAYSLVVYFMVLTMVQSFDQTVRRLSGTA